MRTVNSDNFSITVTSEEKLTLDRRLTDVAPVHVCHYRSVCSACK